MRLTTVANPRTPGPPRQPQPHINPAQPIATNEGENHRYPLDKRSSIWGLVFAPSGSAWRFRRAGAHDHRRSRPAGGSGWKRRLGSHHGATPGVPERRCSAARV